MWMLYALGSAVTASLVAIFGKIGLDGVDATQAAIARSIIMAAVLVVGGLFMGTFSGFSVATFGARPWIFIMLAALAGAASWVLYFLALQAGPAGPVAVIDKLSVIFVILLAAAFFSESITYRASLGLLFTIIGSILIVFK